MSLSVLWKGEIWVVLVFTAQPNLQETAFSHLLHFLKPFSEIFPSLSSDRLD